jgi:hypothetical protein
VLQSRAADPWNAYERGCGTDEVAEGSVELRGSMSAGPE